MQEAETFGQWKNFIQGLPLDSPLRDVILASWERSRQAGVQPEPETLNLRRISEDALQQRLQANKEMMETATPHLQWVAALLAPMVHVAYLVDQDGIVLYATGNAPHLMQEFGLLPGYDWSERTMGTNGAGTALLANKPVAVIGSEYFSRPFHDFTGTGAPIHAPDGTILGAIDISTYVADGDPKRLKVVAHLAFVIEKEIAYKRHVEELAGKLREHQPNPGRNNKELAQIITECKTPQDRPTASRDFHLTVFDAFPFPIWRSGEDAQCNFVNKAWLTFTGRSLDQDLGEGWAENVHPKDVNRTMKTYLRAFRARQPVDLEYRARRQDGEYRFILDVGRPCYDLDGIFRGYLGLCLDLTELKRAQLESQKDKESLRLALDERAKLSRDLHDHTIQTIYGIGMNLEGCQRIFKQKPKEVTYRLNKAIAALNNVIRDLRRYILKKVIPTRSGTKPGEEWRGLLTGLKFSHCPRFRRRVGAKALAQLTFKEAAQVLGIAREALNNSLQHSKAKSGMISVQLKKGRVELQVMDDGIGFGIEKAKGTGLGLANMKARAEEIGGALSVISAPGKGTKIKLSVPKP